MSAPTLCYSCRYRGCTEYGEPYCVKVDDYPIRPCSQFKRKYDDEEEYDDEE